MQGTVTKDYAMLSNLEGEVSKSEAGKELRPISSKNKWKWNQSQQKTKYSSLLNSSIQQFNDNQ